MATVDSDSTSLGLMQRVQSNDPSAWDRLLHLYTPLVYQWCRRGNLNNDAADDLVQEVFCAVSKGIESFRCDREGDSFRGWLYTLTRNKILNYYRDTSDKPVSRGGTTFQQYVNQLPAEPDSNLATLDGQADSLVYRRALQLIETEFEERTLQAFWRSTIDDVAPAHVATDLGMSLAAVYKAKSRVLARLRQELADLIPE